MTTLRIKALNKTFLIAKDSPKFSVRTINLDIREGEFFALLGPSGCGKTTLLKLIAGLITPDGGTIFMGNTNITDIPAEQRCFGMVFQQPLLFPHMTVEDNVAFGLKMQGIGKADRLSRAREILHDVGLGGFGGRFPGVLSGGQQQRVSLARAIVIRPNLLLLDEPLSALDPGIREDMRQLLKEIHVKFQITMIFVTHDRDEAFDLADRIGIMTDGQILQTGSPLDVYQHPNSPQVARFIGTGNVWEGELLNGQFRSGDLRITIVSMVGKTLGPGWLVVRPELFQIVVESDSSAFVDRDSDTGYLVGVVMDIRFRHGFYLLRVDISKRVVEVLEKSDGSYIPQAGALISLRFDMEQVHFIPK